MDTLSRLVDSKMSIEKETTRLKIRMTHLKLQGRTCEDTAKDNTEGRCETGRA